MEANLLFGLLFQSVKSNLHCCIKTAHLSEAAQLIVVSYDIVVSMIISRMYLLSFINLMKDSPPQPHQVKCLPDKGRLYAGLGAQLPIFASKIPELHSSKYPTPSINFQAHQGLENAAPEAHDRQPAQASASPCR